MTMLKEHPAAPIAVNMVSAAAVDEAIAAANAALVDARAAYKSRAQRMALSVLAGQPLPEDSNMLEAVLVELQGMRVIAQLRELDVTSAASPSRVSELKANWNDRLAEFNAILRERDEAMNQPRPPAKAFEWDARVNEIQSRLDAQQLRVNQARGACSHEMSRQGEAKDSRDRLRREHQHLFTQENAA
jgi:hypothetical protein